jgi:hypothetical protein
MGGLLPLGNAGRDLQFVIGEVTLFRSLLIIAS